MAATFPGGVAHSRRRSFVDDALFGAVYGAAVGIAAVLGAIWLRRGLSEELAIVVGLFAVGAALGGFATATLVKHLSASSGDGRRLAASLVCLMLATTGVQVLFLFAEYAGYYAQWWSSGLGGSLKAAASTLGGVGFYYVSIGLPILLPVGFPVLFVSALWLARR